MQAYLIRRVSMAVITFLGITLASFVLIHSVPGDPITFYAGAAGPGASPKVLETIRIERGLDRPLHEQYWYWLGGILRADFGRSVVDPRPVGQRLMEKLPNTVLLNAVAFGTAALIGIPVGLWSARRPGRLFDRGSAALFFILYSLPTFWSALLLMQLFAVEWGWLPLFGMTSDSYGELSLFGKFLDRLRHLILPAATLTYAQLAIFARYSRAAVSDVIRQDFITTARAKGVGEGALLWHHALRNALLPMITLLGFTIPFLFSGSVIVEEIFQWDGVGRLYFQSIRTRDYPMVMALTIVTAVITLLATLVADILYAVADPRVRLGDRA